MLSFGDIAGIFEEIELRIVRSLKRNLSRHKKQEKDEGFEWTSWQAEKLRALDRYRKENRETVGEYTDVIDNETRSLMQEQFSEGVKLADDTVSEAVGDTAEVQPLPSFFGVDDSKVNKLIEDVTALEKHAETAALRLTDDVYRQTINRVQLAMSTGSMTLQQAVDSAVSDFLSKGINCIVYRDGRRVNIADYVRMALRTTAERAKLQGMSARAKELGYDTVAVSQYSMCSETCLPWQGRVYIEDVFSMWDGEIEERGDELWGKSNYCGKWFPLLSTALHKGLFHPNCRHTMTVWIDGVSPMPEKLDNSKIEANYKLEQQQRALEREVRKAKRKVEGLSDPENVRKAKAELREKQKKLREFVNEHADVLRRDYGREKVYDDIPKKRIDNSSESGIIESGSETMYRKPKPDKVEPMPRKQFRKIVKSFKRNGGIIQFDDDTEKYLDSKNAEAITYNENTILIRKNPGRASVYEELIHTAQYKSGRNDGSYKCRLECEIEAQKKLIKYSKAYNLTEREIFQTQKALEAYENELREYYKNGGV